jgi:hypothetical protein
VSQRIKPRVNEAREFLEIAKDFKDPKEIIREALSNSWDAEATHVSILFDLIPIPGTRKKKIRVTIQDDGKGMSSDARPDVGSSEIEGFFNLGDSGKTEGSIGTKGHGTKIYYKSHGITVDTWKNEKHIHAHSEVDPWESLQRGVVPTFVYDEEADQKGSGTRIVVDGFEAKPSEFSSLEELIGYITWYTVAGSFGHAFGRERKMDVTLRPAGGGSAVTVPFGFHFPEESLDLESGSDGVCKIFGPTDIAAGMTSDGRAVKVQLYGAVLGEANRAMVPHTYEQMGLWLAKDFIRVERNNPLLEEVFKGQYYYRNFLLLANCQQFDLTANRNNIRTASEEYDIAIDAIKGWCMLVKDSEFAQSYFARKREEDDEKRKEQQEQEQKEREQRALNRRQERINGYKGRSKLIAAGVLGAPLKEPRSEAETALLLQAMISSRHPGIDFTIGDYSTSRGVDLLVERSDKGFTGYWWVELVSTLDNLAQWSHHPDGYHAVVCYALGQTPEFMKLSDGRTAQLVKKASAGRYTLLVGSDTLEVYVLSEILAGSNSTSVAPH